jgi:hypothetical protein
MVASEPEARELQDHGGTRGASGEGVGKSTSLATLILSRIDIGHSWARGLGVALAATSIITSCVSETAGSRRRPRRIWRRACGKTQGTQGAVSP